MVERGEKRQTIRAPRRDGRPTATVGDTLYLFAGMRTKACRRLGEAKCQRTAQVVISEDRTIIVDGSPLRRRAEEDAFAERDGFRSAAEMVDWFSEVHGLPFHGTLVQW
jgi:hypothetical protein